jgi:hypothetical protein
MGYSQAFQVWCIGNEMLLTVEPCLLISVTYEICFVSIFGKETAMGDVWKLGNGGGNIMFRGAYGYT